MCHILRNYRDWIITETAILGAGKFLTYVMTTTNCSIFKVVKSILWNLQQYAKYVPINYKEFGGKLEENVFTGVRSWVILPNVQKR